MARQKIDLLPILKRYKVRVVRVTSRDDHFLVETTRGPLELRVWPRPDVMQWSFAWREHLAAIGFPEVERFIRTRDNKPFVVTGKRGFTLTSHEEKQDDFLFSHEHIAASGPIVASMHEAQQANPFVLPSILLNRELEAVNSEVLRARGIRETLTNNPALLNQRDKWVAGLFAPMLQRMERSADLLDGAELDDDSLAVSHRRLRKKNWRLLDGKLFLHGFYRPTLSVQLCDVACFLREIYTETGDVKRVEAFLDGYETVKPLTYGEYKLLLGFMTFPREVWKSIFQYVSDRMEGKDQGSGDQIEGALQKQMLVDQMMMQIAERAEQARSGGRV